MTSIESLPVEILLQILHLAVELGPQAAGVCAAVSRKWQKLVEEQTFALLRLNPERISAAKDILTPARQSYVRHIRMDALLPLYDAPTLFTRPETDEDRRQNDQAFTRAIVGLFGCLSRWEPVTAGTGQPGVTLELHAYSPADKVEIAKYVRPIVRKRRWKHSFLSLENGVEDHLPTLAMITKFVVPCPRSSYYLERHVAARVCGVIASKLTNLEAVDWDLEDNEKEDIHLRRRMRREFAASLANFPQNVRHFRLMYPYIEPNNHDFQPPRAYDENTASDPLSIALRNIAQQCTTFTLDGTVVLDTGFFWPQPPPSGMDETPYWPLLEEVRIMTNTVSPSGAWLFDANPLAPRYPPPPRPDPQWVPEVLTGEEPVHLYRVCPDQKYLGEWCLAAARAAARMPRLRFLAVQWSLPMVTCLFVYDILYGKLPRFYSGTTPALKMTAEAEQAWRAAARVHIGDGVEMELELEDLGEIYDAISTGLPPSS